MAGGTTAHSRVVSNLIAELHRQFNGTPCAEYESNQRLNVLVSQEKIHLEVYERQANNTWLLSQENRLNASVDLPGTGTRLSLAEVYDGVVSPPPKVEGQSNGSFPPELASVPLLRHTPAHG